MKNLLKEFNTDTSKFPYIEITEDIEYGDGCIATKPLITKTVHVWSKEKSKRECKDIMLQIYDKVHGNEYRFDSQVSFRDSGGELIRGIITFTRSEKW